MDENVWIKLRPLRTFFYLVSQNETTFDKVEDVPDYTTEAIPSFVVLILLEQLILWIQGKTLLRLSDGIGSISSGMLQELTKSLVIAMELTAYIWFYERFCIVELPWDSAWTWWLTLVGADFAYYWLHRMSHEVNIMWAAHQVHHSSEDYNLTTALRQSAFQHFFASIFYLPMAFFVPPSIFFAHLQLNILFQFYIHTCAIGKMGFLDYIINTPSNHRVHHGRNRYCIDKNYAAVFMIWDQLFGTYEPEGDEIVYGLVHPLNSFEPLYVQFCHYIYIWKTFWETEGIGNKFSVLFKGPGWTPGQPRLGNIEDIPDISAPCPKYDPSYPRLTNVYLFLHFACTLYAYQNFAVTHTTLGIILKLTFAGFLVLSLISFGAILDSLWFAPILETIRCVSLLALHNSVIVPVLHLEALPVVIRQMPAALFLVSAFIWLSQSKLLLPSVAKTLKHD